MDLITNLPLVEGFDSTLVVVDRGLFKGVILCPCAKMIMWEEQQHFYKIIFSKDLDYLMK
jgi:hypothetical protein